MNNTKLSLLAFVVALFCLVSPSSCDPNTEALIYRICSTTRERKFCINTLFRNLKSPIMNVPDLTRLTVDISLSFAENVLKIIKKREPGVAKDPAARKRYEDGIFAYEGIAFYLKHAKSDADKGDFKSMNDAIVSSDTPMKFAESVFGRADGPLLERNRKMRDLITMVLYEKSMMR